MRTRSCLYSSQNSIDFVWMFIVVGTLLDRLGPYRKSFLEYFKLRWTTLWILANSSLGIFRKLGSPSQFVCKHAERMDSIFNNCPDLYRSSYILFYESALGFHLLNPPYALCNPCVHLCMHPCRHPFRHPCRHPCILASIHTCMWIRACMHPCIHASMRA